MASTRRTLELIIEGITNGLGRAVTEAEAATRRLEAAERSAARARASAEAATTRLAAAERTLQVARLQEEAALSRIGVAETRLEQTRANANGATTRLADAEARLEALRQGGGSAQAIAQAEDDIRRVRQESDTAAAELQRAEAALAQARASGAGATARLRAAEEAVERARRNAATSADDLARAEAEVARRRRELDDANNRGGFRSFLGGLTSGVSTFRALGNLIGDTSTRLGGLGQVLGSLGGPIVRMVVGLLKAVAATTAWVEVVGVLGGLLGQVLGGAVPLLLTLAAVAGTAALGMDGIKKAAEVMKPAFDKLKAAVSATFEKGLTPAFRELAAILPQLTPRFQGIAKALSDMAAKAIGFLTSAHGIGQLNTILAATAKFIDGLSFGVTGFIRGLVDGAAAAAPAMQALGTAFGNIFDRIGQVFSRLGADGTIQRLVQGLASTLNGLSAVIAPIIELLLRMGAALGDSVGIALTNLGGIIQATIPFFEKIADVAGRVLVDAFQQLRGPLEELINSVFPGFSRGLDGFAALMHTVVLPALRDFINWVRTDGIPGIIAFTQGLIVNLASAGSAVLGFVDGALAALQSMFTTLGVATNNQEFLKIAGQIEVARGKVQGLKQTLDTVRDKTVAIQANAKGEEAVKGLAAAIFTVTGKTVSTISNVFGTPENDALTSAITKVFSKVVATTGNVPGGPTLGTQGNNALTDAIGRVTSKTVAVTANVNGTSAVQGLINAIGNVVSKTVTVTVNTIQRTLGFASGGLAPGGTPIVVGEKGPELIVLPKSGGFVFTADQTRGILGGQASASRVGTGSGGDPITVTVNLSQQAIAGIAEVVIQRRDRTTRRTVLAGSGATF